MRQGPPWCSIACRHASPAPAWRSSVPHGLPAACSDLCACTTAYCTAADEWASLLQFIDWGLLPRALLGVLCLLCGNGYIVGINQIYDVDIDTVNKPFLPVAAGK